MSSFEDELRALGKRRIGLPELRAAWLRAHPESRDQPEQRRLLLDALRGLESEGTVDLPGRGWDTSGSPALPRTARLRDAVQGGRTRTPQAWLPALDFAADERHPVRRADLQAVNAFLLSVRGREPVRAPTRERSLQIFGDEKRLDDLRKGGPALFEGRVTLDDLHCYPVAPPLPHETPPKRVPGRPILVLENYHSWDSFRRWNHEAALYAAIAYGGGNAFRQGAGNLDDLVAAAQAEGALYLGDLDPAGVRILIGVNRRRQAEGAGGAAAPSRPLSLAARPRPQAAPGTGARECGDRRTQRRASRGPREGARGALVRRTAHPAGEFRDRTALGSRSGYCRARCRLTRTQAGCRGAGINIKDNSGRFPILRPASRVKATGSGAETCLVSFHKAQPYDLAAARRHLPKIAR